MAEDDRRRPSGERRSFGGGGSSRPPRFGDDRRSDDRRADDRRFSDDRRGPPRAKRGTADYVEEIPGVASRRAAAYLLDDVLTSRMALDEALSRREREPILANLDPRDRAFALAIVMASLRHYGQIQDALARFTTDGLPNRGPSLAIVSTAAAQLLFLGSPAHAVIDIAVRLIEQDGRSRGLGGFANAVLRKVAGDAAAVVASQDALALNTPQWLLDRWTAHYGEATARAIAAINQVPPALDLTVRDVPEEWAAHLGGVALPNGTVRLKSSGRIEELSGYDDGAWWVQDAAASLPARLLGDVTGLMVADLCAAPGGKTAQIAAAGAEVWAVDSSGRRLSRLDDNLARLGLEAHVVADDVANWIPGRLFDAVLLDAPCSSTGTIRRNPDVAWLKTEADLKALAKLQAILLHAAVRMLKPGGRLVYATCSLEPEEGEHQIRDLLATNPALSVSAVRADELPGFADTISAEGYLRTLPTHLPHEDPQLAGCDGFFAGRLVKAAN